MNEIESSRNRGQELWSMAKEIIPGGGMLFSKRAELHHPSLWPSYYRSAKGITIETLDGAVLRDFSTMSVGTCSLGYGNEVVDDAVKRAVSSGVMSTLNSPDEVFLVETLLSLHPTMALGRLLRTGGEANALAIRAARAATNRDKVAFCGYHGWHDWYLSANLSQSSSLDSHLMSGLGSVGVPSALKGTSEPFTYGDIDNLRRLLISREFAAVKMEVSRSTYPDEGFLREVRELCTSTGTLLIFDECTSGFRETFGGLYKSLNIDPDLVMLGKALGNGYAITAVLGTKEAMNGLNLTFASSTFWTERLGPAAALATIQEMKRLRSYEVLPKTGATLKAMWKRTLEGLGYEVSITGLDALAGFSIRAENWNSMRTLFTQEMLDRGFLATTQFYASCAHGPDDLAAYETAFEEVWAQISKLSPEEIETKIVGPSAQASFRRMN